MRCEECGATNPHGALFCHECGSFLTAVAAPRPQATPAAPQVHIYIPHSGRQFTQALTETLWLGRADPESGFRPDLDLTPDGGVDLGVSRQHATLEPTPTGPVVVDQGSANGAWLDGVRLEAQRPYPLPAKAELRLGDLRLHVSLV